jgi:hypothetical protein
MGKTVKEIGKAKNTPARITTSLLAGRPMNRFLTATKILPPQGLPALGFTQPPIHRVPGA